MRRPRNHAATPPHGQTEDPSPANLTVPFQEFYRTSGQARHRAGKEATHHLKQRSGHVMDVTWIACYRKKVAHAVPADVHSPAYDHPGGLIDAVCGITVYPLRVAEANARRSKECAATLLPGTSGDAR
jgi:hypothetical protein